MYLSHFLHLILCSLIRADFRINFSKVIFSFICTFYCQNELLQQNGYLNCNIIQCLENYDIFVHSVNVY